MNEKANMSLWVQVFLAYKYLNEFLKDSSLKDHGLNPYDYFLLNILRVYENLTFYEINKHLPIDVKSLHKKINDLAERGLIEREFLENGSSSINLSDRAREVLRAVRVENIEAATDYFERGEISEVAERLCDFNEKMRNILELELSEEVSRKLNELLL